MDPRTKEMPKFRERPDKYTGKCFVVKDNIDTDQIIPAEYLTLVPSKVMACRAVTVVAQTLARSTPLSVSAVSCVMFCVVVANVNVCVSVVAGLMYSTPVRR